MIKRFFLCLSIGLLTACSGSDKAAQNATGNDDKQDIHLEQSNEKQPVFEANKGNAIDENIQQLIRLIPNHGLSDSAKNKFDSYYYALLEEAWAIPSNGLGGIGDEEWLYYFISGNGEDATRYVLDNITTDGDHKKVDFQAVWDYEDNQQKKQKHTLYLKKSGEKWIIENFDGTKNQLEKYIKEMRAFYKSPNWAEMYDAGLKDKDIKEITIETNNKVNEYFNKYRASTVPATEAELQTMINEIKERLGDKQEEGAYDGVMKGNIGPHKITFYMEKFEGYSGFYYYDQYPKNIYKLKTVKEWDFESNNMSWFSQKQIMEEYTKDGKKTGTFEGTFYNAAGRGSNYEGDFTNSKGEKFKFSVSVGNIGIQ